MLALRLTLPEEKSPIVSELLLPYLRSPSAEHFKAFFARHPNDTAIWETLPYGIIETQILLFFDEPCYWDRFFNLVSASDRADFACAVILVCAKMTRVVLPTAARNRLVKHVPATWLLWGRLLTSAFVYLHSVIRIRKMIQRPQRAISYFLHFLRPYLYLCLSSFYVPASRIRARL